MGAVADWIAANSNFVNDLGLAVLLALSTYVMVACGQLSLATPAYAAIGAYTAALLTINQNAPFIVELVAGCALAAAVAFLLGLPLLRLRGIYLSIASIGFVAVTQVFFLNWPPGGEGTGIPFIPSATTTWQIYLALALLLYTFWRLEGSPIGRGLRAIRQDEAAARSLGIDTVAHKLGAFAVSGLIGGLVGVLYARLHFEMTPLTFGFQQGVDYLTYVIVGGSFYFLGSPLGALLITALPQLFQFLQGARAILDGVVLLAVILFLPGGLVDLPGAARAALRGGRPGRGRPAPIAGAEQGAQTR